MKKLVTSLTMVILALTMLNCAYADKNPENAQPDTAYSINGQQRAKLLRAITVAEQNNDINRMEANSLRNLIELGKGYPQMLNNYIHDYKSKGKSMDQFMRDVFTNKLPSK